MTLEDIKKLNYIETIEAIGKEIARERKQFLNSAITPE
jgi:hypothetical protein